MTDSTSVLLPVFQSGGLPIRLAAAFPSQNLESNLYTKAAVIHSGDIRLVLHSLKYQVVSFRTQNKTVLPSAARPVHKTLTFFTAQARPNLF